MLLVNRFAGTEWIAVGTRRRLQLAALALRSRVVSRLWDRVSAGELKGLTAAEKRGALDLAVEMVQSGDRRMRVMKVAPHRPLKAGTRSRVLNWCVSIASNIAGATWTRCS